MRTRRTVARTRAGRASPTPGSAPRSSSLTKGKNIFSITAGCRSAKCEDLDPRAPNEGTIIMILMFCGKNALKKVI